MEIQITVEDYFKELKLMEEQYGLEEELYPWIYMLLKIAERKKQDILKEKYKFVSIRDVHNRKGKEAPASVEGQRKEIFKIMSSKLGGAPDMLMLDDGGNILGCIEIKVLNEHNEYFLGIKTGECFVKGEKVDVLVNDTLYSKIDINKESNLECDDMEQIIRHIERFNKVLYTNGLVFYFIDKKEQMVGTDNDIKLEVSKIADLRVIYKEYRKQLNNNMPFEPGMQLKHAVEWEKLLAELMGINWYNYLYEKDTK